MRLLLFAFLAYLVYVVLSSWLRLLRPGERRAPEPSRSRQGEEMVRDPRCGTFVPRGEAFSKTAGGKTLYFCSRECRDAHDGRD